MNTEALLAALSAGEVRAANQAEDGSWVANEAVKSGILAVFRAGENVSFTGQYAGFVDKGNLPVQQFGPEAGVRMVPGGSSVRAGAYLSPGVVMMPPSYVNIGAYVDAGTMIDSHVLVGSCAQVGKHVHLSAGVQLGGVLEPVGLAPVVIEDGVFVGANAVIVDGICVKRGAVIAPSVVLSQSVQVFDCVRGEMLPRGAAIPEQAVVVPGSRPASGDWARERGLMTACAMIVKYRDEKTDAALVLEDALRS